MDGIFFKGFSGQDTGERGSDFMKKKANNFHKPIGGLKVIPDFLPSPSELVLPQETVKITLSLTKSSLEFFKREASRYHIKYQKMIRELVDRYANKYQN